MAQANKANKANKANNTTRPAPTSTLATLTAASTAPVTAAPAAPVKRQPVALVNGLAANAPANAIPFVNLGAPVTGQLVPHVANQQTVGNVARLPQGSVTVTAKGMLLKPTGSTPAQAAWAIANWQAIQAAIASAPQTATQLAMLIGNAGAAHINHRIKGGHLAVTK